MRKLGIQGWATLVVTAAAPLMMAPSESATYANATQAGSRSIEVTSVYHGREISSSSTFEKYQFTGKDSSGETKTISFLIDTSDSHDDIFWRQINQCVKMATLSKFDTGSSTLTVQVNSNCSTTSSTASCYFDSTNFIVKINSALSVAGSWFDCELGE